MDINSEQFLTFLRSALHYLYDPDQLRRSPLAVLFGLDGRMDTAQALKTILLEAIDALRPGDQEPAQSREWLVYDVLFYRYVRGYSREAVANQLGMSDRQLSRERRTAIETLALCLLETYPLEPELELLPGDLTEEAANASGSPQRSPGYRMGRKAASRKICALETHLAFSARPAAPVDPAA